MGLCCAFAAGDPTSSPVQPAWRRASCSRLVPATATHGAAAIGARLARYDSSRDLLRVHLGARQLLVQRRRRRLAAHPSQEHLGPADAPEAAARRAGEGWAGARRAGGRLFGMGSATRGLARALEAASTESTVACRMPGYILGHWGCGSGVSCWRAKSETLGRQQRVLCSPTRAGATACLRPLRPPLLGETGDLPSGSGVLQLAHKGGYNHTTSG